MDIKGIDNLDVGMSNIEIEGKVTYTLAPRNVTGEGVNGHYDFWSQFVVIADETGKIGCNVVIDKENYKLEKGVMARVKGKLEEYENKKGEMQKSLRCSLIGISKGNKVIDVQQEKAEEYFENKAKEEKPPERDYGEYEAEEKDKEESVKPLQVKVKEKDNVWEAKDLRIARECAVKAVTELVCAKIMKNKDFFTFANTIVKYIYNGLPKAKEAKPTKEENLALARHIAGGGKLELKKGKHGLMDDEEEEEEPGSSINNAIPFKGKRKKISEASDFISDSDIPDLL